MNNLKVFVFLLVLVSNAFSSQKPLHKKLPTPHVDVFEVQPPHSVLINNMIYPGEVKAFEYVSVVAKVKGTLKKAFFKEGNFVKKSDILFKIDDTVYRAKVQAAKANLDMVKANLYKAEKNWQRVKKLYKEHSVSQKERDRVFSEYNSAFASLENAKANLKLAQIDLDYTNVKAPINGITTVKKTDAGNYVTAGTPLVDIYNIDKVYVYFSLPESDFEKLNSIYTVKGRLKADVMKNGKVVSTGFIDYKDRQIDKSTSTVKFRAVFPNVVKKLLPGDFVKVKLINVYRDNVMLIPQKSLLQGAKGMMVFTVKNGKVSVVPVFSISDYKNDFIVKGLLKPGEKVIVNNFFRIRPGSDVVVDRIINKEK
jgi:membrane fusion protein (multidrug efflux system)